MSAKFLIEPFCHIAKLFVSVKLQLVCKYCNAVFIYSGFILHVYTKWLDFYKELGAPNQPNNPLKRIVPSGFILHVYNKRLDS